MTVLGEYWIIRHKPTGGWLPELEKPVRGGYTHTEPCTDKKPRRFTTERGAKNALWWWLRGITTVRIISGDAMAFSPEPEEDWDVIAKPGRIADEMEVISVSLIWMQ